MEVLYRTLELDECDRIREVDASQYIGRAWRNVDGYRQLVEINYQDTDFPNGFEDHLSNLKNTIRSGGIVLGAKNVFIAFYFAIGCEETKVIDQDLYQTDTRDYQLEFDFMKL